MLSGPPRTIQLLKKTCFIRTLSTDAYSQTFCKLADAQRTTSNPDIKRVSLYLMRNIAYNFPHISGYDPLTVFAQNHNTIPRIYCVSDGRGKTSTADVNDFKEIGLIDDIKQIRRHSPIDVETQNFLDGLMVAHSACKQIEERDTSLLGEVLFVIGAGCCVVFVGGLLIATLLP